MTQTYRNRTIGWSLAALTLVASPVRAEEAPQATGKGIGAPLALGFGLDGATAGQSQDLTASKDGSAGVDEAQGGGQSSSNNKGQIQSRHTAVPPHHQTPPSVHSGASNKILRPDEHGPIRGEGRVRQ